MERSIERTGLLGLDAREFDHLGPLLSFVGDELAEVFGGAPERCGAQFGKPRLHLGIGEAGVDLSIELVDNCGGGGSPRADAPSKARLVARGGMASGWDIPGVVCGGRRRRGPRRAVVRPGMV